MNVVRVDYNPTYSKKNSLFSIDIDNVNIPQGELGENYKHLRREASNKSDLNNFIKISKKY